jgi:hypothetical protein
VRATFLQVSRDDHRQFTFEIDLFAAQPARQNDRITGILNGIDALHEQDRKLRKRCICFRCVLAIVETDTKKRGRRQRREQLRDIHFFVGWFEAARNVTAQSSNSTAGVFLAKS